MIPFEQRNSFFYVFQKSLYLPFLSYWFRYKAILAPLFLKVYFKSFFTTPQTRNYRLSIESPRSYICNAFIDIYIKPSTQSNSYPSNLACYQPVIFFQVKPSARFFFSICNNIVLITVNCCTVYFENIFFFWMGGIKLSELILQKVQNKEVE